MTEHPIEVAAAIAIGGLIAVITWLLTTDSKVELPEESTPVEITEVPAPKPSMKLSRKQLLQLAREHQIHNARWRAHATKAEFVLALQREVG